MTATIEGDATCPVDDIQQAYNAADTDLWCALLAERVKTAPTDGRARLRYAEAFLVTGNVDKAIKSFLLAAKLDPAVAPRATFYCRIAAAVLRRAEVFAGNIAPPIWFPPETDDAAIEAHSAAVTAMAKRSDEGAKRLREARKMLSAPTLCINGGPPATVVDLDDRLAVFLEVFRPDGDYGWLPLSAIEDMVVRPAETIADTMLRPAMIKAGGDLFGPVLLPTIYPHKPDTEGRFRLGHQTDWQDLGEDGTEGPFIGLGRKCFSADNEMLALTDIQRLTRAEDVT